MLKPKDIFKITIKGLFLNKIRSLLSLLGIIIGTSAVVSVIVIGEGKEKKVTEFVNRLGADIIIIDSMCFGGLDEKDIGNLDISNLSFIKKNCHSVKEVSEVYGVGLEYYLENDEMIVFDAWGVEPQFAKMAEIEIVKGRFITQSDIQERRKVCVVEQTPAIFSYCKKNLRIGDYLYCGSERERVKIIGFCKTKKIFPIERPGQIPTFWPSSTTKEVLIKEGADPNGNQIIYIQAHSPKKIKKALKEVKSAIKRLKGGRIPSNLQPYTHARLVEEGLKEVKRTVFIMLAIALISLIVSGIGIMNVMYISILERTKEIGIRRAVGAKEIDIILQFLMEAVSLCLSGGIIGALIGLFVVYYFIPFFDIPFVISYLPIITSALLGVTIGIIAGLKPAIKASKLDPVEVLR